MKEDEKTTLQEYIKLLKAERASVKLPTHQPLPGVDSAAARINAGIGAKVAELQRTLQNTLSPEAVKPKMEKGHLLRELQNMRVKEGWGVCMSACAYLQISEQQDIPKAVTTQDLLPCEER